MKATGDTALLASTVGGDLIVTTTLGNIVGSAKLDVVGSSTFTANGTAKIINLTDTTNVFATGASVNTAVADGGDATLKAAVNTVMLASTVGGNLSITSTTGDITGTATITVSGTSTFTTNAINKLISLTNVSNNFTGAVSVNTNTGGDAKIVNGMVIDMGESSVGGDLNINTVTGNIIDSGITTVGGDATFRTTEVSATTILDLTHNFNGGLCIKIGPVSSECIGDPYIYSMLSEIPVKLPDVEECYRLYESGDTFINAEVQKASEEHTLRMKKYVEQHDPSGKADAVCDGFFFSKFFISSGHNMLMVELRENKLFLGDGGDADFFKIHKMLDQSTGGGPWRGAANNFVIEWLNTHGDKHTVTVSFFTNPHIENGLGLQVENLDLKATGLCVRNYRPKLMTVPKLTTMEYPKLRRRLNNSKNQFQQKNIKGKNETWVTKRMISASN